MSSKPWTPLPQRGSFETAGELALDRSFFIVQLGERRVTSPDQYLKELRRDSSEPITAACALIKRVPKINQGKPIAGVQRSLIVRSRRSDCTRVITLSHNSLHKR